MSQAPQLIGLRVDRCLEKREREIQMLLGLELGAN